MVIPLKMKRRDLFWSRQHSYFGVTHCENSEVQIAVFSKWNMLREWKLVKDLLFVYLQPSLNQNSLNPAIVTLQFDDVTVKTIYWKFDLSVRSVAKKDDTSLTHPWMTSRTATLGRSSNLVLCAVLIKLVNKTIGQIVWQLCNQSNQSSFVWIRLISTIE